MKYTNTFNYLVYNKYIARVFINVSSGQLKRCRQRHAVYSVSVVARAAVVGIVVVGENNAVACSIGGSVGRVRDRGG